MRFTRGACSGHTDQSAEAGAETVNKENTVDTLTITNVDLAMLEQQRQVLNEMLFRHHKMSERRAFPSITITETELKALLGIENMLDTWSDENALANKGANQ